ncbi:MAG TPA: GNAT family N-acetyltransferase [Candidatus Limnocylindria bacterium]|jgi:GNAT superfamily N-acetyltransferase
MTLLGAEQMRGAMIGDPALTPSLGLRAVRRAGLFCFSSTKIDEGVFNHVSGYGSFAEASQGAIDAVLRHYDRVGSVVRFEVIVPTIGRSDLRLLERNGFRDVATAFQVHVRAMARPPRARAVDGLVVRRARARDATAYAKLASRGFGDHRSRIGRVFEHGWVREIRRDPRVAAFIGSVDGAPAATGVTILRPTIAGLYSGSVIPAYRGRGIQNAMIAARLAHGWTRGLRAFYSWTEPDSASAENLRDEGFRTRFELHIFRRDD